MNPPRSAPPRHRAGFSLVELIVVIGIIALLIALLLPALSGATRRAKGVVCASNMRQIGTQLFFYQNDNRGHLYPVGPPYPNGAPQFLGTNKPPHERWPTKVFTQEEYPEPSYDASAYNMAGYDPVQFPAKPWRPDEMECPDDPEPYEAHSYVLNAHLTYWSIKASTTSYNGLTSPEVILLGEKVSLIRDYYMERRDFERVVEKYRHGERRGSNYLFLDNSVRTDGPSEALAGVDPWDPVTDPEGPPPPPPEGGAGKGGNHGG